MTLVSAYVDVEVAHSGLSVPPSLSPETQVLINRAYLKVGIAVVLDTQGKSVWPIERKGRRAVSASPFLVKLILVRPLRILRRGLPPLLSQQAPEGWIRIRDLCGRVAVPSELLHLPLHHVLRNHSLRRHRNNLGPSNKFAAVTGSQIRASSVPVSSIRIGCPIQIVRRAGERALVAASASYASNLTYTCRSNGNLKYEIPSYRERRFTGPGPIGYCPSLVGW